MPLKLNYRSAALRVCVDQAEDGQIRGRIVSQRLREPFPFTDVNELVLQIDALMDAQKYPQAFQRPRSFRKSPPPAVPAALEPEEMMDAETVDGFQGELGTFLLHISTRRNSTWQGHLDWLDDSSRQRFTSTLEFLNAVADRYLKE